MEDQIEGMNIAEYVNHLVDDINEQSYDPLAIFLGSWFLDLGIRKKDRSILERVKKIRNYSITKVNERLKELVVG